MGKLFHRLSFAAAMAALSLCAGQASAVVYTYDFQTSATFDGYFTGFFTAEVDSSAFVNVSQPWLPGDTATLVDGDWTTCGGSYNNGSVTQSLACEQIVLTKNGLTVTGDPGDPSFTWDQVDFYVAGAIGPYSFYFDPGAFVENRASQASIITGPLDQDGGLPPSTASINAVVPEPATWAMMIMGCGMMGAALRRRRAASVAA